MKKHGRKKKNKKKILEGLLDGKTLEEIENSVTIKSVQIGRIRDQLIEEGQTTEEEIKEARRKAREEKKKEKRKKLQKENGDQEYRKLSSSSRSISGRRKNYRGRNRGL